MNMSDTKLALRYALVFTLASFLWVCLEYAVGLHTTHKELHPSLSSIFAIPAIAIYAFALHAKRTSMGGTFTFWDGFMFGLLVTGIVAVLSPGVQYVFHTFVNPHFFADFQAYSIASGKLEPDAAAAYFCLQNYLYEGISGALMMGTVTAAIVALILSRKG